MTTDTFTLISFWAVLIVPCLLLVLIVWQHQEWLKRKEAKAQREFDAKLRQQKLEELDAHAKSLMRQREFRDRLSYADASRKNQEKIRRKADSDTHPIPEEELRLRHPLHGFVPNPDPLTNTATNPYAFGGALEGEFAGAGATGRWSAAGLGADTSAGDYPPMSAAPSYVSSSSSSSSDDDGGSRSYSSSSSSSSSGDSSSSSSSSDSGSSSCSSSD